MLTLFAQLLKNPSKFDCLKSFGVLNIEGLAFSSFHVIATVIFICAVIHTLSAHKIHHFARMLELKHNPRIIKTGGRALFIQILYFLSEVELIFGIWVIPLLFTIATFYDWKIAIEYINTRDYTESLFVVVIMSLAATRPIIHAAETALKAIANSLGGTLSAWWFTLLTLGPILGSLITEPGAMALSALLLSRQFYDVKPSHKLAYATLGLLFVNISVGGVLTNFASPAVLVLSHAWHWTTPDMFYTFGWKAVLGILLSNASYWFYFRNEFKKLGQHAHFSHGKKEEDPLAPVPSWIIFTHIFFLFSIVMTSHYPALFIAIFIFFIGFHHATRCFQYSLKIARPMMVGYFLAGLVIHSGLQGWWVVRILQDASPNFVMGIAMLLTGFNDNTAIACLSTLVPNWGDVLKYAIFTGVIAGGGLTVIANAPNPAGYQILRKYFGDGISPVKLFLAALFPTLILYAIFYIFSPLGLL